MPAAAAELGVHRDEIYIMDGEVILYHPTIDIGVGFARGGGEGGGHACMHGGGDTHQAKSDDGAPSFLVCTIQFLLEIESKSSVGKCDQRQQPHTFVSPAHHLARPAVTAV